MAESLRPNLPILACPLASDLSLALRSLLSSLDLKGTRLAELQHKTWLQGNFVQTLKSQHSAAAKGTQ